MRVFLLLWVLGTGWIFSWLCALFAVPVCFLTAKSLYVACPQKINAKNSWSLNLIDYISDVLDTRHGEMTNFQVCCCCCCCALQQRYPQTRTGPASAEMRARSPLAIGSAARLPALSPHTVVTRARASILTPAVGGQLHAGR